MEFRLTSWHSCIIQHTHAPPRLLTITPFVYTAHTADNHYQPPLSLKNLTTTNTTHKQMRHASAPTPHEARTDHQYLQRVKSQPGGGARIRRLMYSRMRDMCLGRPALVWDDVSSFQTGPGGEGAAVMSFGGATPVGMDLFLFSIPGAFLVWWGASLCDVFWWHWV